jgi:hypothetical protein
MILVVDQRPRRYVPQIWMPADVKYAVTFHTFGIHVLRTSSTTAACCILLAYVGLLAITVPRRCVTPPPSFGDPALGVGGLVLPETSNSFQQHLSWHVSLEHSSTKYSYALALLNPWTNSIWTQFG